MKTDIILAGVGGQGILSIAAVLSQAALSNNLYVKQAEVHGMSQRGGDVQSHLRLSSSPIHSDLIPLGEADLVLSLEPMEALRYLPWLSSEGTIVTNENPVQNINPYPSKESLDKTYQAIKHKIVIDAETIAKRATQSVRPANMVMLGAAAPFIDMNFNTILEAVKTFFSKKGEEVVSLNLKACQTGYQEALK